MCENEPDPPENVTGNLKISITYPEAVIENNELVGYAPVPGDGAVARLYDAEAECIGYLDAKLDIAFIGDQPVISQYQDISNSRGEIIFRSIKAGRYYLIIFSGKLYRYTEKYIEIPSGDTLHLHKEFTIMSNYSEDLEPWDATMPTEL